MRRKSQGPMLMLLPIVFSLVALPAPAASPSAAPAPLQEIGTTKVRPLCVPIVAHANVAISHTLDNDRSLAILSTNLKNTDFDRQNVMARRQSLEGLVKSADDVRIGAAAGENEAKRLREIALASSDPQRKAELKAFADALGGALLRQKRAAAEIVRGVTILQGRIEAREAVDLMNNSPYAPGTARTSVPDPPSKWNEVMRDLAASLGDRVAGVVTDEGVAAGHSIAATNGC